MPGRTCATLKACKAWAHTVFWQQQTQVWICTAGVMARSVSDIAMFNKIFTTCNSTLPNVTLAGMRIGYATNWWANLGTEVSLSFVRENLMGAHAVCSTSSLPITARTQLTNSKVDHLWYSPHTSHLPLIIKSDFLTCHDKPRSPDRSSPDTVARHSTAT